MIDDGAAGGTATGEHLLVVHDNYKRSGRASRESAKEELAEFESPTSGVLEHIEALLTSTNIPLIQPSASRIPILRSSMTVSHSLSHET